MTHARTRALAPLALALLALAPTACTGKTDTGSGGTPTPSTPATAPGGAPVFPLPADTEAAIKRSGLAPLPAEGMALHLHAHLDVIIDDKPVVVPANIGINVKNGAMVSISPLHTHTPDGVIHVESDKPDTFRVAQLFAEWGVKLDKSCIATYCVDDTHQLLAYANGELAADPTSIEFADNLEIAIWYGPKGSNPKVPTSWSVG